MQGPSRSITLSLTSLRRELDPDLCQWADEWAAQLSRNLDRHDPIGVEERIREFERDCAQDLIEKLLGEKTFHCLRKDTHIDVDPACEKACRQQFRDLKRPLKIAQIVPFAAIRPTALVVVAAVGAVLGVYLVTPVTRLLLGYREVGLIIGGPIGAALAVWVAANLVSRPALWKWLNRALIVGGVAWLATAIWQRVMPLRQVWQQLRGTNPSGMQTLKAAALFLAVLALLCLARPQRREASEQLERSAAADILAWLRHQLDLLALLLSGSPTPPPPPPGTEVQVPSPLIAVIDKLSRCHDRGDETSAVVDEIVQEWQQFRGCPADKPPTFYRPELDEYYELFGLIPVGAPVEVLKEPILAKNGSVVIRRGCLQKKK